MAQIEWSEGGQDPRIKDWVMRESIALTGGTSEHYGSVDIPEGVKVEAIHVSVSTAVSGGDVYKLEVGLSNDGGVFFPCGYSRTFSAGTSLFNVFSYAAPNLEERFLGGTDDWGQSRMESSAPDRTVSAGASASQGKMRVVLYTTALDGEAAVTTAGAVSVTVYGRRFLY